MLSQKSIRFGVVKIWYRKEIWIRYSVFGKLFHFQYGIRFGFQSKFQIRFHSDFGYRHTLCARSPCCSHWNLSSGRPSPLPAFLHGTTDTTLAPYISVLCYHVKGGWSSSGGGQLSDTSQLFLSASEYSLQYSGTSVLQYCSTPVL